MMEFLVITPNSIGDKEQIMTEEELECFLWAMNACGMLKGIDYKVEQIH